MKRSTKKMSDRDDYHKAAALGSGDIKKLALSPAHYYWSKKYPFEATPACDLGTTFHMMLLEPEKVEENIYFMEEKISFATKEGKELKKKYPDKIFISPEKKQYLNIMMKRVDEIHAHLKKDLLKNCLKEHPIFWTDRDNIAGKALFDAVDFKNKFIIDIKTTAIMPEKAAVSQEYYIQAGWYARGLAKELKCDVSEVLFLFFVFETQPPFSWRVFNVQNYYAAEEKIELALNNYLEYLKNPDSNLHNGLFSLPITFRDLQNK